MQSSPPSPRGRFRQALHTCRDDSLLCRPSCLSSCHLDRRPHDRPYNRNRALRLADVRGNGRLSPLFRAPRLQDQPGLRVRPCFSGANLRTTRHPVVGRQTTGSIIASRTPTTTCTRPDRHGFWHAHFGWFFTEDHKHTDLSAVSDLAGYPELVWLDRHPYLPAFLAGFLVWLLAGWSGLVVGFFWSTVVLWHATFSINSLAHVVGRRRYETGDQSRNNLWLALLTFGEGWHNNHHHYQTAARPGLPLVRDRRQLLPLGRRLRRRGWCGTCGARPRASCTASRGCAGRWWKGLRAS